jgi:hypothetical protein
MSTPPNFLDFPWRWHLSSGRWRLLVDPDGSASNPLILSGEHGGGILTRDPALGMLRLIEPSDDIAKIVAAAPLVRRHARALLNGIELGFLDISDEAEPSFRKVVSDLREALEKSGGA